MSVHMVQARIKAGKAAEMEKAARDMFAAIDAAQPQGVRYASSRLADGETHVILLALDDDKSNPLAAVPAFLDFQENLKNWLAGPPAGAPRPPAPS
jgi:hypothetical protein